MAALSALTSRPELALPDRGARVLGAERARLEADRLQHAREAGGRLGVVRPAGDQVGELIVEIFDELGAQLVEWLNSGAAPDPETVVDLQRVLRRERPQIVHAHNWIVHSYLPLARGGPG